MRKIKWNENQWYYRHSRHRLLHWYWCFGFKAWLSIFVREKSISANVCLYMTTGMHCRCIFLLNHTCFGYCITWSTRSYQKHQVYESTASEVKLCQQCASAHTILMQHNVNVIKSYMKGREWCSGVLQATKTEEWKGLMLVWRDELTHQCLPEKWSTLGGETGWLPKYSACNASVTKVQ